VTLLTEQKAATPIDLVEELQRDLRNVRNRHDSDAAALTQAMSPDLVLAVLDERSTPETAPRPHAGIAKAVARIEWAIRLAVIATRCNESQPP
jgi:hypothetical protein